MNQHIAHRLVGYDATTERVAFERVIPDRTMPLVREIARVDADDPDAVGSYALSADQAHHIADIIGVAPPPRGIDFFLEPGTRTRSISRALPTGSVLRSPGRRLRRRVDLLHKGARLCGGGSGLSLRLRLQAAVRLAGAVAAG
jgi:hypothetical protein